MQGLKSAILAIFWDGPGWPCPVSVDIKKPSQEFKKIFLFWVPVTRYLERLEGKTREGPFF